MNNHGLIGAGTTSACNSNRGHRSEYHECSMRDRDGSCEVVDRSCPPPRWTSWTAADCSLPVRLLLHFASLPPLPSPSSPLSFLLPMCFPSDFFHRGWCAHNRPATQFIIDVLPGGLAQLLDYLSIIDSRYARGSRVCS